jgi:cytochrome P450
MITHRNVQRKAQEELDQVVGRERLPDLEDRKLLPYISALLKEDLRWYPVVPIAVPHSLIADDMYEGMELPEGSIVTPNIW